MNRRETVEIFRKRLTEVIERAGTSRAAFAARVGLDRSTLSQLLASGNTRLPRAETIAAIASEAQVSVDWLLGLSQEEPGARLIRNVLEISEGAGLPMDDRMRAWHAEAVGYKIRYVPTTLPELLKTPEVIRAEYREYADRIHETRIQLAEEGLAYSRRPETDMEVCCAYQQVESFARGEGVWRNLPLDVRRRQMALMAELTQELYPTFRWFLYDGLQHFSVPITIFGPKRAVVYVGDMFFVFNATEHVRVLTGHFDGLIRHAVVQPTEVPDFLATLLADCDAEARQTEPDRKGARHAG
ncbi:MAG: helix-turn-helix transcriptional regulator [Rhodovibrionaceae bacterium]|nr:helix-turn-helix transcriptional regulator [Rhodovibrionaceae bacterium]